MKTEKLSWTECCISDEMGKHKILEANESSKTLENLL